MGKTKFIFDLDGTLLKTEYDKEKIFFENLFGEDNLLSKNIGAYLGEYERTFLNYEDQMLCDFLTKKSGYNVTLDVIRAWIDLFSNSNNPIVEGAPEILEELKKNNKKIILLSNWYTECQQNRLINAGIFKYFDHVYGGDFAFKPNKESFILACGNTPLEECVMIGDSYENDVLGARSFGITALYLTDNEKVRDKCKIKSLKEIKEWI